MHGRHLHTMRGGSSLEESLSFLAVAGGMVFVAALAQSLTGFGFALVLAPLLSLVWDPRSAVVVSSILNGTLSLILGLHLRRQVSLEGLALLLVGALAGIPLGLATLSALNPSGLRVLIGVAVVVLGLLVYSGKLPSLKRVRPSLLVAGLLSGVLQGSTSMSGPPAILCLMSLGYPKEQMRATLLALFGPLAAIASGGFWVAGMMDGEALWVALAMTPPMGAGIWLGALAFRRVRGEVFRAIVVLLIVAAGTVSVATGVRGGV